MRRIEIDLPFTCCGLRIDETQTLGLLSYYELLDGATSTRCGGVALVNLSETVSSGALQTTWEWKLNKGVYDAQFSILDKNILLFIDSDGGINSFNRVTNEKNSTNIHSAIADCFCQNSKFICVGFNDGNVALLSHTFELLSIIKIDEYEAYSCCFVDDSSDTVLIGGGSGPMYMLQGGIKRVVKRFDAAICSITKIENLFYCGCYDDHFYAFELTERGKLRTVHSTAMDAAVWRVQKVEDKLVCAACQCGTFIFCADTLESLETHTPDRENVLCYGSEQSVNSIYMVDFYNKKLDIFMPGE
ncbi:hypothetical protein PCE1_004626 [Barthelona sp. PCE]